MTSAATAKPYRPAVRGLIFGLIALGLRGGEMLASALVTSRTGGDGSDSSTVMRALEAVFHSLPWLNLVATLVALVGVGYAAIAAHRREWSIVLILAWVTSVIAAVLDIEFSVYSTF